MTTTVLRPNATNIDDTGWVRTGGTTKHGVTSDDSDATFIATQTSDPGSTETITFGMGTVTLTTGSRTKTAVIRARVDNDTARSVTASLLTSIGTVLGSGSVSVPADLGYLPYTVATFALGDLSQADVDGLQVSLSAVAKVGPLAVAELYLDLTEALQPVTNITYPTGAPAISTTNRPTITWTYTPGADGGAQTRYEVKVYTAAQYGAGGFDPDTSLPYWTSGEAFSSGTSKTTGPLANSTTYRAYVRTAQTINGAAHWSAWDFEGFSIAVTTADISAITATPQGGGRILIAVDRSGSAWDFVEVQRSIDAGTTWSYVRGGEYVPPATTTLYSTGDANNFDINDWEVPNGTMVLYRARATRILSGLPITGAWVQTSAAVAWTSGEVWLKAPDEPALNRTVQFRAVPEAEFPRRQGAIQVLNRTNPVVISDVLSGGAGTLTFQTADDTEMRDLFALLRKPVLLLHPTPGWAIPPQYIAPGGVRQTPITSRIVLPIRLFDVAYHQVDASADALAGSP